MTGVDDGLETRRQRASGIARDSAADEAGRQGLLFGDDVLGDAGRRRLPRPDGCSAAGITYRQLDYWARTGLVEPSVRSAHGSGSQRLYSFRDILVLKVVKRLLDTGVSLQNIRTAVEHLRDRGVDDLAQITLMSDGASVYECTSADEVIDLVQGGQGVFGIAVGRVWREVEGSLAELPSERVDGTTPRRARGRGGRRARRPPRRPRDAAESGAASRVALGLTPSHPRGRVPSQPATGAEGATPRQPLRHPDRAGGHLWKAGPHRVPADGASRGPRAVRGEALRRADSRGNRGGAPAARPRDRRWSDR